MGIRSIVEAGLRKGCSSALFFCGMHCISLPLQCARGNERNHSSPMKIRGVDWACNARVATEEIGAMGGKLSLAPGLWAACGSGGNRGQREGTCRRENEIIGRTVD